jgi:hypothetical protein
MVDHLQDKAMEVNMGASKAEGATMATRRVVHLPLHNGIARRMEAAADQVTTTHQVMAQVRLLRRLRHSATAITTESPLLPLPPTMAKDLHRRAITTVHRSRTTKGHPPRRRHLLVMATTGIHFGRSSYRSTKIAVDNSAKPNCNVL